MDKTLGRKEFLPSRCSRVFYWPRARRVRKRSYPSQFLNHALKVLAAVWKPFDRGLDIIDGLITGIITAICTSMAYGAHVGQVVMAGVAAMAGIKWSARFCDDAGQDLLSNDIMWNGRFCDTGAGNE